MFDQASRHYSPAKLIHKSHHHSGTNLCLRFWDAILLLIQYLELGSNSFRGLLLVFPNMMVLTLLVKDLSESACQEC